MVIPRGRDGARSGRAGYLPEIPSPRRSSFAYYLYKLRANFISHTRDHNGRHRSVFSPPPSPTSSTFSSRLRLSATGFFSRLSDIDIETRHRDTTERHDRETTGGKLRALPTIVAQQLPRLGTTYRRRCGRAARALHCRKPGGLRLHRPARCACPRQQRAARLRLSTSSARAPPYEAIIDECYAAPGRVRIVRSCAGARRAASGSTPYLRWAGTRYKADRVP